MTIGVIANTEKKNIISVIRKLLIEFNKYQIGYYLGDEVLRLEKQFCEKIRGSQFVDHKTLFDNSQIVISIGGDGTMLNSAYLARNTHTPLLGVNFGKLGFLAEFDVKDIEELVKDISENNYEIEDRMALEVITPGKSKQERLYAINDLVISKGDWPKMIEITLEVDNRLVTSFAADGIIIATPTGSTGYSLSVNGPIVHPKADAITLNPIAPHTLTIRPLVLSSYQKIKLHIDSPHSNVHVNCDGQRVYYFEPQLSLEVYKGEQPMKLVRSKKTNYFDILRSKLLWGLDVRNKNGENGI